ncbi:tetratricopeptide repeat protein [Maridesulfovibrio frigidus]|uniref:tetratricopeptide repeat protein n=1 Tax=Maridesulfovibrio frigidus TaxID=340956 RepID=UPI0004E20AE6|nr:hypothetical protein [Maridesulfovibrio frigidus]
MTGRRSLYQFILLAVMLLSALPTVAMGQPAPLKAFELGGLYQSSLKEKGSGWYPLTDYVVFIADLERKGRGDSVRDMRAKSMLKAGELMRSWSASECGKVQCDLSRWPDRSRKILQGYLEKKIQTPSFAQFHGHVVENAPVKQRYRYAFAVPKVELKQFCSQLKQVSSDPMRVFSQALEGALKYENYPLAATLFFDAGLPHLASLAIQEGGAEEFCMDNYSFKPSPLSQRNALKELLEGKMNVEAKNLHKLPGSYEILSMMAESSMNTQPERSFSLLGLSLPTSGDNYADVLDMMNSLTEGNSMVPPKWQSSGGETVKMSMLSLGNLRFGEGVSAFDDGYLKQAVKLFSSRGDKNKIKELLIQAADKTPANPKVWDYLGAILKADNQWAQASVVYLQLLQIRVFDSEAMGHLAECYSHMGRTKSASVIAEFMFYSGRVGNNKILKRITQQIRGKQ